MKQRAAIVTAWTGTGNMEDPFRPLLSDHFQLDLWSDVSGNANPEVPDTYTIEVVAEDSVIESISEDSRFSILWTEDVEESGDYPI